MPMRHTVAALAVGAMMAALPGQAEAAVFQLTEVTTVVPNPPPLFANDFPVRLTISDAAVSRGTFTIAGSGSGSTNLPGDPSYTGDVADFVSLFVLSENNTATPTRLRGQLRLTATFAADRTVSSFNLNFFGDNVEAILSGTGGNFISGTFGADRPDCNATANSGLCRVSGRLVEVPEPMSFALLGMGLLGITAARRKRG